MTFWESTISALLAAVVAGLLLKLISARKSRSALGDIKVSKSNLRDSEVETKIFIEGSQINNAGNIDITKSNAVDSSIKSNVSVKE